MSPSAARSIPPGQPRLTALALLLGSVGALSVVVFVPVPATLGAAARPLLVALSLVASATLPVVARGLGARLAPADTLAVGAWTQALLRAVIVEGAFCEAAVMLALVAHVTTGSTWPLVGAALPLLGLLALVLRVPSHAPTR